MMYFFKHWPAFVKVQVLHMALYIKVKRGFTFSIKKTLSEIGLFKSSPSFDKHTLYMDREELPAGMVFNTSSAVFCVTLTRSFNLESFNS